MSQIYPILFVDLLKNASYKNAILLSLAHKQLTYFSKKYSKSNRITLSKANNLSTICDKDNIKAIKYLDKHRIMPKTLKGIINFSRTIMCKSAIMENIRIMRHSLNHGADNSFSIKINNKRYDVLSCCCLKKTDSLKMIKLLLDKGVNVHDDDDHVLRVSAKFGLVKTVKYLLSKNANIHAFDDDALVCASSFGHTEIVKLLLNANANVHNNDALFHCVYNGHTEIVKLLLNANADVHCYDNCALRLSAQNGHTKIVKLLLDAGANVHGRNNSSLRRAAKNGHIKIVKLLLDAGANIHAININSVAPNIKTIIEEKLKLI